jgi:hypoxanthine phosphoribosyltransferase
MKTIKIKDKEFGINISSDKIQAAIKKVALNIDKDYAGQQPLFIAILNGSFMFAADLFKYLNIECEISFIKVSSYEGTQTTEKVNELIGLNQDIKGRKIILLEDIVDTGITMDQIIKNLKRLGPSDIKVATLLSKPAAFKNQFIIDYVGIEIPNDFIVGFGLDYDGLGRNFPDIYKIVS